jgi:hypothetical protein
MNPGAALRALIVVLAVGAFAPAAAACPTCGVAGQGGETLMWVLGFLAIPYVVVSGVWIWMKHLMASEGEG